MKAEIEIECKEPEIIIESLKPESIDLKKFDIKLKAEKDKIKLEIKAENISNLLAGINSYMKLIKVAIDAMEV